MVQAWIHGMEFDSWYRLGLMVWTQNHGKDLDSWYTKGIIVYTWNHGVDLDSWYNIGTLDSHERELDQSLKANFILFSFKTVDFFADVFSCNPLTLYQRKKIIRLEYQEKINIGYIFIIQI